MIQPTDGRSNVFKGDRRVHKKITAYGGRHKNGKENLPMLNELNKIEGKNG